MTRPWPFRHLGLKLLSVVLAVLLWMTVSGEETVERGLRVPLELQQFPAGLEIMGDVPATVDVRIRGGMGVLGRLGVGDVVAMLDLRNARPGQRLFTVTPEQVRKPFGVEVVQILPSAVAMTFESSKSRSVKVVPAVDGLPAPGFVVGRLIADPASVEIVGPESAVKRATEAMTEPISVWGAREQVRETVSIGMLDPALRRCGHRANPAGSIRASRAAAPGSPAQSRADAVGRGEPTVRGRHAARQSRGLEPRAGRRCDGVYRFIRARGGRLQLACACRRVAGRRRRPHRAI
ncbi:MAG: hypothetical protein DMF97_02605 [Acidobacteria bacterium]|nr:MAG: hypothetical protein DMF97_02605 [Acidobacteriota bacterium]